MTVYVLRPVPPWGADLGSLLLVSLDSARVPFPVSKQWTGATPPGAVDPEQLPRSRTPQTFGMFKLDKDNLPRGQKQHGSQTTDYQTDI